MFTIETKVTEDTFTPWAESKLATVDEFKYDLMNLLANLFLQDVDPLVPYWSGSLQKSAHYLWHWTNTLEVTGLNILWTGQFNLNEEEWKYFENPRHEDYALRNYLGEHHTTGTHQPKNEWVEKGLDIFDNKLNRYLRDEFLRWLLITK